MLDQLRATLDAAGVASAMLMPMARTPAGGRRRADLTLRHTREGMIVGFAKRRSHDLVDLAECPVLLPALVAMVPPLRRLAETILPANGEAEAVINWTDSGADLLLVTRLELDLPRREAIAAFAETADVARIAWGARGKPDIVLTRRPPKLRFGNVEVEPPPGAFLQASFAGEATLRAAVKAWSGGAKRVVDLYGGLGTLSLPLLPEARLTIVEGSRSAVAAVNAALRKATLAGVARAEVRDLKREPLAPEELDGFDLAMLDPPAAGAAPQARELAQSAVPTVIYASCDPRSFAADARVLVDGGYRLERLLPVDQFLWSTHVELIALFRRIASG
ncbi:MAG: class I SAM-dependent RNA methyltransferase [Alphaproteobacteria bacterium]|nr:class I SAM-dependent RNA methyltransferase [Alphaproteobacteria bacterium]MCW5739946.1 class I SAM-dependent RNA methyltransferase [Alphaproteobacteria bacterium]